MLWPLATSLCVLAAINGVRSSPLTSPHSLVARGWCQEEANKSRKGSFNVVLDHPVTMQDDTTMANPTKWYSRYGDKVVQMFDLGCQAGDHKDLPMTTMYFYSDKGHWQCTVTGIPDRTLNPPWSFEAISPDNNPGDARPAGVNLECRPGW